MASALMWVVLALSPAGASAQHGDAGREAIARYGCTSCHEVPGIAQDAETSCVGCHQQVVRRSRGMGAGPRVTHYLSAPDLARVTHRLDREYLVRFLMDPHDVRPRLEETMPRLPVTEEDARAMVGYLERVAPPRPRIESAPAPSASRLAAGEQAFRTSGCPACHSFGNYDPGFEMPADALRALGDAPRHAPNLRFVRDRMDPDVALAWIRDPRRIDPATHLEPPDVTAGEALAIRDFLYLGVPGAAAGVPDAPRASTLEPLDRPVRFAEVRRIFGRSCIHCHAHSDDGGTATSLGYDPVALDLSSYDGVLAGARRPDGTRVSLIDSADGEVPILLARLLRRHGEAPRDVVPPGGDTLIRAMRPQRDRDLPGMPLGLPPLPERDLRVVATWIAQGAPR